MFKNGIMGNLKYFSLLMAAGMFAACSDNLDEGYGNDGAKTGEGYVKVAINLPTVSGSRAENFGDGTAEEYAVKKGIIAFFEGTSEDNAKFVKAYSLNSLSQGSGTPDQISATVSTILEAPLPSGDGNQIYALVILNPGNLVTVSSQGERLEFLNGSAGNYIVINNSNTVKDLRDVAWTVDAKTIADPITNGFFMINSPLYKTGTEGSKVFQTLVPVTVHSKKEDATTAEKIYVERVVAKVDLELPASTTDDGKYTIPDGAYKGSEVIFTETGSDLGWTLNVTNKTTKPVRDVTNNGEWSTTNASYFFGTSLVNGEWKRIYWAKDNNYDKSYLTGADVDMAKVKEDFNVYSMTDETAAEGSTITWGGYTKGETVNAQYCLENTDVAVNSSGAQNYNEYNTTSVLIKAKFNIKKDGEADADYSFFTIGADATTYTTDAFLKYIAEKCELNLESHGLSIKVGAESGYYEGFEELKNLIDGIDGYATQLSGIGRVAYYKDGDCYYYAAPIQHFEFEKPEVPISNDNYLGKYGVVRNNWYNIKITKVSAPGLPEITDPEGPVEKEEGYINCEINVLSWAKRSQNVDL